jgi:hypothetical protein
LHVAVMRPAQWLIHSGAAQAARCLQSRQATWTTTEVAAWSSDAMVTREKLVLAAMRFALASWLEVDAGHAVHALAVGSRLNKIPPACERVETEARGVWWARVSGNHNPYAGEGVLPVRNTLRAFFSCIPTGSSRARRWLAVKQFTSRVREGRDGGSGRGCLPVLKSLGVV